jgi:DNA polymerase-2
MYVDSLFVQKDGLHNQKDFVPLLENIQAQTGIALEGVYKWLAFPPSKRDRRVPVPNRYFGALLSGEIKARGIALRRHDTCRFVAATQLGVLQILAQADDLNQKIPETKHFLQKRLHKLKQGEIQLDDLLVAKKLSRSLEAYKVLSPAAQAARQLQEHGIEVRAGMRLRFWFVFDGVRVGDVEVKEIDVKQYSHLLDQAIEELPFNWGKRKDAVDQYLLPAIG